MKLGSLLCGKELNPARKRELQGKGEGRASFLCLYTSRFGDKQRQVGPPRPRPKNRSWHPRHSLTQTVEKCGAQEMLERVYAGDVRSRFSGVASRQTMISSRPPAGDPGASA
jgi:hypothetical protein